MSFRGKQWMPPDPAQVEENIKDRLCLTELTIDSLQDLFNSANLEVPKDAANDEFTQEVLEESATIVRSVNKSYYDNLKLFEKSVKPDESVNIVIPVYNSVHLVEDCIKSVLDNTNWPYHLTIVDDASDQFTHNRLERWADLFEGKITLITNKKNKGFAATVNR